MTKKEKSSTESLLIVTQNNAIKVNMDNTQQNSKGKLNDARDKRVNSIN